MDMAPNREQDSGSDGSVNYTVKPQLVGFNTHLVQFRYDHLEFVRAHWFPKTHRECGVCCAAWPRSGLPTGTKLFVVFKKEIVRAG